MIQVFVIESPELINGLFSFRLEDGKVKCDDIEKANQFMNDGKINGKNGKKYSFNDGQKFMDNIKYHFNGSRFLFNETEDKEIKKAMEPELIIYVDDSFEKAKVKQHTSKSKSGKIFVVKEHDDKRSKRINEIKIGNNNIEIPVKPGNIAGREIIINGKKYEAPFSFVVNKEKNTLKMYCEKKELKDFNVIKFLNLLKNKYNIGSQFDKAVNKYDESFLIFTKQENLEEEPKEKKPLNPWIKEFGHLKLNRFPPEYIKKEDCKINLDGVVDTHSIIS